MGIRSRGGHPPCSRRLLPLPARFRHFVASVDGRVVSVASRGIRVAACGNWWWV